MPLSQAQIDQLIDGLIIDNSTQQVTPSKLRQVLHAINQAGQSTDLQAVEVYPPLVFDQYNNILSLPPVAYKQRRVLGKGPGMSERLLPEPGDIMYGWSPDGKEWWDSALYNGGNLNDRENYTVVVGNTVFT